MNEDVVYGLLAAILLVCYIIAIRIKSMKNDVECMHDFVHAFGGHSLIEGFMSVDSDEMLDKMSSDLHKKVTKNGSEDVPAPFEEWDES